MGAVCGLMKKKIASFSVRAVHFAPVCTSDPSSTRRGGSKWRKTQVSLHTSQSGKEPRLVNPVPVLGHLR
jgi:hypothetical protein